jgi:hypothetical protein
MTAASMTSISSTGIRSRSGRARKARNGVEALSQVRRIVARGARRVGLSGDLVHAGLDDARRKRQRVGEAAQLGKRNAVVGARDIAEIGPERIVELAAP